METGRKVLHTTCTRSPVHTSAQISLGMIDSTTRVASLENYFSSWKYHNDESTIRKIIELLKAIGGIENFDFIIPVPSSKMRVFQPADAIATALGEQRGVHVLTGYLEKDSSGAEIKGVTDPEECAKLLKGVIRVIGNRKLRGKKYY